ncbi:uncharacterized protein LOC126766650 [Bactrocera neohumeralis]|uniref:uncharacterized protein LOC126766650 n=1 Tax=Bactrocera neohumeralis TaxID=98809 RepID=UPI00216558A0|nr:uncharacterized protein LOC126766650 [Bactrocera neohumeralis]
MRFLVDSGSVISLMPKSAINHTLTEDDLTLVAANGTVIRTYGRKVITLDFSLRRTFNWSFIIADVKSAILGADFLVHFALLLDLKGRCLIDTTSSCTTQGTLSQATVHSISTIDRSICPGAHDAKYLQLLNQFIDITHPSTNPVTATDNQVAHHIETTGPPVFESPARNYK